MLGLLLVSLFTLNTAHAVNFFPYDVYGSAKSFSDQVILNPPVPHSQVGAIWAKEKNELAEWTLEVKYRVNGPEHGGKGMAIWYAAGMFWLALQRINMIDNLPRSWTRRSCLWV